MQQTNKYQLNLIETSDPFSPVPLNENAGILEAQLARLDGADAAEAAAREALDQRVTALEVQKIFFGEVVCEDSFQVFNLGFTPKALLLIDRNKGMCSYLVVGDKLTYANGKEIDVILDIVENGFAFHFFDVGHHYNYIAFA